MTAPTLPSRPTRPTRRWRPDDDTGSMAFYLVIAIVGLAIAALLVPMVTTASRTTRSDTSRVHALDAAQAGLNVMVGEIRAAQVDNVGTSTKLPCGTRTGTVNGVGAASYSVSVAYYTSDPVTTVGAQAMTCVDGYGTYDPVSDGFTPKFARITAIGRDGTASNGSTAGRRLATTYTFRTTNSNIAGGRIRIYPSATSTVDMCMDAGSATPAAGTLVKLQTCASPPKDQQVLAYRTDLTIQLVSSVTATYPNGLCLDYAPPAAGGRTISLSECLASLPYTQQWSFNDYGGYTASNPTSAADGGLTNQCLSVPSQSAGVQLVLATCQNNASSPVTSWVPAPAVGAGAAQAPQLVNYAEFGRCVDVTGKNTNTDHFIDYPCKQNPFPGAVAWNQKFTTPGIAAGATSATGQITTTPAAVPYCLTSPVANEGYVTVALCVPGNVRQVWTVYNGAATLPYSLKYTIQDNSSRCLGLTPQPKAGEVWSAIDSETCTGATEQKWNAAANLAGSVLQDTDEIPLP